MQFLSEPWSDLITLQARDEVAGNMVRQWRRTAAAAQAPQPVVLDEERYESYLTPPCPRRHFRQLLWASMLAGGSATYGGTATYEPAGTVVKTSVAGMMGYGEANRRGFLHGGADHLKFLAAFFDGASERGLADGMTGLNPVDPGQFVDAAHMSSSATAAVAAVFANKQSVSLPVPSPSTAWKTHMYNPRTGVWLADGVVVTAGTDAAITVTIPDVPAPSHACDTGKEVVVLAIKQH